jgi:hypothetical protein
VPTTFSGRQLTGSIEPQRGVSQADNLVRGFGNFFCGWVCGGLLVVLGKVSVLTWCFGGEVVVFCVVKVVIKQSPFVVTGNVTRIPDFFLAVPVLGIGT